MSDRPEPGYTCCAGSTWVRTADFGHTQGIEFTLGQCNLCGRKWMHLWTPHAPEGSYVLLDDATVARLAALTPGRELRRALEDLFDL